jgi:ComF family protein
VEGRISHEYVCYLCVETPRSFDRARSAARFEGVLQRMIIDFKYNDALWVQDELVDVLASCHGVHYAETPVDAIACVPLFHARERARGFNQADVLAGGLARRLRKPFLRGALSRLRATETQTHLTARERADNVKGAFRVRRAKGLQGKRILLVDDVMTTGATLNECARALKQGGAAEVYVLTLARGGGGRR